MSRTVHHVRYKHRDSTKFEAEWQAEVEAAEFPYVLRRRRFFYNEERHWIRALRYSAAILAEAAARGDRPRPEEVSRRLESYAYPRTHGLRYIGFFANRQERGLRAADRAVAQQVRHVVHSSGFDAAWDVDWQDPRHRHFAVWDSW